MLSPRFVIIADQCVSSIFPINNQGSSGRNFHGPGVCPQSLLGWCRRKGDLCRGRHGHDLLRHLRHSSERSGVPQHIHL